MPPQPLPPPSAEQLAIVAAVRGGSHVVVGAVAGSGKTTSVLHLARDLASRGQTALLLTYNARLKNETRRRCAVAHLATSLEVHSFHAAGVKYFGDACSRDDGLRDVCTGSLRMRAGCVLPAWSVIVIDEAQDVTPLLFGFVCRLLEELRQRGQQPQLCVLGDARQAIYEFNGSDARYLSLAPRVWPVAGAWATCYLRTSYRVSPALADFVNQCLLGEPWMDAAPGKPYGQPVHYYVGSAYTVVRRWAAEIHHLVAHQGVRPDEIFILAPSVRAPKKGSKDTPLATLLRELLPVSPSAGRRPLPVYHNASDDAPLNSESVALGSIVVSTFHQAKGLERRFVYALGWDGEWFKYFGRNVPLERRGACTNEHYTCATRAITRLSVCAEREPDSYLPFIQRSRVWALSSRTPPPSPPRMAAAAAAAAAAAVPAATAAMPCVTIIHCDAYPRHADGPLPPRSRWATEPAECDTPASDVTSLLRHLSGSLVAWCMQQLAPTRIAPAADEVDLPLEVPSVHYDEHRKMEAVSDFVGLAIPALLEAHADGLRSRGVSAAAAASSAGLDYARLGSCTIASAIGSLVEERGQSGTRAFQIAQREWGEVPAAIRSVPDALKLSVLYEALSTGFDTRLQQLPAAYDWLSEEQVDQSLAKLQAHITAPEACHYEVELRCNFSLADPQQQQPPPSQQPPPQQPPPQQPQHAPDSQSSPEEPAAAAAAAGSAAAAAAGPAEVPAAPTGAHVHVVGGVADVVTGDGCLYEIKVVKQLAPEHLLQLAIYAYMWLHPHARLTGHSATGAVNDLRERDMQALAATSRNPVYQQRRFGPPVGGLPGAPATAAGTGAAVVGNATAPSSSASASAATAAAAAAASPASPAPSPSEPPLPRRFRLLNLRTGEAWELGAGLEALERVVSAIVLFSTTREEAIVDAAFLERVRGFREDPATAAQAGAARFAGAHVVAPVANSGTPTSGVGDGAPSLSQLMAAVAGGAGGAGGGGWALDAEDCDAGLGFDASGAMAVDDSEQHPPPPAHSAAAGMSAAAAARLSARHMAMEDLG